MFSPCFVKENLPEAALTYLYFLSVIG